MIREIAIEVLSLFDCMPVLMAGVIEDRARCSEDKFHLAMD